MPFLYLPDNYKSHLFSVTGILQLVCSCMVTVLLLSCRNTINSSTQPNRHNSIAGLSDYQAATTCKNCHSTIYKQFTESMHARSFENPIVQASFFNELLPRAKQSPELSGEVSACIACHSPLTFARTGGDPSSLQNNNQDITGVDCDLCHTISGYTGGKPEGGNFISTPGVQKFGPFQYKNDHHRTYSELHTKSEFCGICHNRTNRYGLEIISTFSEWKESRYATEGIECQDCHMNALGFLTGGVPVHESGTAAQGTLINAKKRSTLYSHRFPGAHSKSQVAGAITLGMRLNQTAAKAGEEMVVYVDVDNSNSGHKLPTGSAELRLLYLNLVAKFGDKTIPIAANSLHNEMFDISGKGKFDAAILGQDIPQGSRIYRAISVNPKGEQALFSFDAQTIIFDNRLEASEVRQEFFIFQVPDDVGENFTLTATLHYLRYPGSLADRLNISRANPIELASVRRKITIHK